MLLVLPPPKTKRATLFLATQGRTWVVKRATLLFNLVCSNIGKQVALFCCPFYCSLSLILYSFLGVQTSVFIQNYRGFGGMLSGKKKKIGLSKTTYPAFPESNAINLYAYFVELSDLSVVIQNTRALFFCFIFWLSHACFCNTVK